MTAGGDAHPTLILAHATVLLAHPTRILAKLYAMSQSAGDRIRLSVAIALLATVCAMLFDGVFVRLDARLYDFGLSSRPARRPANIAICGIDDDFMAGRPADQVPRDRLARLVDAVSATHPQAIEIDVYLSARFDSGPEGGDAQLRAALLRARARGVPVYLSDVAVSDIELALPDAPMTHGTVEPYFASAVAGTGSVAIYGGPGGVARNEIHYRGLTPIPLLIAGVLHPPAVEMADLTRRLKIEPVPLDFDGPPGTVLTARALDLADGPAMAWGMAGKLVFIGGTFPASRDFIATPYTSRGFGAMYGVEVLAQATDTLVRGAPRHSPESPSARADVAIAVFLLATLVAAAADAGAWPGILAMLFGLALAVVIAVASARDPGAWQGFAWPASPFFVGLPLAGGARSLRKKPRVRL